MFVVALACRLVHFIIKTFLLELLITYLSLADCLKYYVLTQVYQECDGMEYELSATKFDLRFIPDEMTFDQDPKEKCDRMPRPEEYKPQVKNLFHGV